MVQQFIQIGSGHSTTDVESDWLSRSRAAGVFLADNYSERRQLNGTFLQNPYADSAALRAASTTNTQHTVGEKEVLLNQNPLFALSGGKSLEIKTFSTSTAAQGGSWQARYKSDGSFVNGYFFQFSVYLPRDSLAWRLPATNGQMKICNLEQFGNGQVVVMASNHLGFPTLLLNGSGLNERRLASVPYRGGGDWFYQTAIDSGSSLAAATREAYLRRYGPGREIYNFLQNYGYISGNQAGNMMYNRGFAWPNADALLSGAVPYNMDDWTTITVYVNNSGFANFVEPFDVVKMWVSPYGQPPKLVCDLAAVPNDDPQSLGTSIGGYQTYEPLWYDTAFGSGQAGEDVGYRPTQQRWYTEFLGTLNPPTHPGGYPLPGI